MPKINSTFRALADEATFTKEMLASGTTQIGKANYAQKGIYFQAFTSLATGLERVGKLCLMLDYYVKNNGQFPDRTVLKNQIGHNLQLLYQKSKEIVTQGGISFQFLSDLDGPLHQEILIILSDFAKGDRYSNIDFLVTQTRDSDPIFEWYEKVDKVLYDLRVSDGKKKRIESNANLIHQIMSPMTMVLYSSESGNEITTLGNASFQTGMNKAICKYRQLYVLQIIRYWTELLGSLQHRAMGINNEDIPAFSEIFAIFYNYDDYFLTRKTYENLR